MPTPLAKHPETTKLSPINEVLFKVWAKANHIEDVDNPESFYDYRGFYQATNGAVHPSGEIEHFPDTFKQHGHPTFSQESKYSTGPADGGMWLKGDVFVPQPPMAPAHDPLSTAPPPPEVTTPPPVDPSRELLLSMMRQR